MPRRLLLLQVAVGQLVGLLLMLYLGVLTPTIAIVSLVGSWVLLWIASRVVRVLKRFVTRFRTPRPPEPPPALPPGARIVVVDFGRQAVLGSLVIILFLVGGIIAHIELWGDLDVSGAGILAGIAGGVVLHEATHALGWKFAGRIPWGQFRFGVLWRYMAPYCHCKAAMSLRVMRFGALLPLYLTGLLPLAVGFVFGDATCAIVGFVLTVGAVGDIAYYRESRSFPPETRVMDHPSDVGFLVLNECVDPVVEQATPAEPEGDRP